METPSIVIKKSPTFIRLDKQMWIDLRQVLQGCKERSIESDIPTGRDKQEKLEEVFI